MGQAPDKLSNSSPSFALRFQKLKADIHRQLVEMLDISKLGHWKPERLRREVRDLATRLTKDAAEMLSEVDRERLIDEIMAEVFGLGPLEGLMKDPTVSDILVNGPAMIYVERHGRLEPTDLGFRRQRPSDADHPAHRRAGRPPRRRDVADGGCPLAGRLARQRHHSAAGAGRAGAVDSPLRRASDLRRSAGQRHDAAGDADAAARRPSRPASAC